jgi:hypothetical protein
MIFSSVFFSSSWVWPIAASIGGIIVLWGLWMENGEEKDWFSSAGDFRWQKSKAKIGRAAVMVGIAIEIGIGFAMAAKDESVERKTASQMEQTKTNVLKIDPLNQPIKSVEIQLRCVVEGWETVSNTDNRAQYKVEFVDGNTNLLAAIICDDFRIEKINGGNPRMFLATFKFPNKILPMRPILKKDFSVNDANEKIAGLILIMPDGITVGNGSCTVLFNNWLPMSFFVPIYEKPTQPTFFKRR